MKPRLLDLFCGAGGAAMGYARAGFEVVGVDIKPQPHYPFEFIQADAMTYPLDGFDAIHASPPCQDYSMNLRGLVSDGRYLRLIEPTLERLIGRTFVVENVVGAPIPSGPTLFGDYGLLLCGTMFGMRNVQRHRLFQTSMPIVPPGPCVHRQPAMNPYDAGARERDGIKSHAMRHFGIAMGIDWMSERETSEAIPPAYTEFIGKRLLEAITPAKGEQ